jgi:hypothetical protein
MARENDATPKRPNSISPASFSCARSSRYHSPHRLAKKEPRMQLSARLLSLVAVAALVTACASQGGNEIAHSGFLNDYTQLHEDEGADQVYTKPALDLSAYNAIMIEPVQVIIDPDKSGKGFDPEDGAALAAYFENALVDAVKDKYPMATIPGPGVLAIRAAITEMRPGKPAQNLLTTVSPTGLVLSTLSRATTGSHLFVGRATVEAEVIDATTSERFIAIVDREAGKKHDLAGGSTEWGQVKAMFDAWALDFRQRIDNASMPAAS